MRIRLAALLISIVVGSFAFSASGSAAEIFPEGQTGYDISFPQCGGPLPKLPYAFGIVGATGGRPFTHNPCLATQYAWAALSGRQPSLYMNLKSPIGTHAEQALTGPAGNCRTDDGACLARNFGYKVAQDAVAYARSQNALPASWWLDIETTNTWSTDTAMNAVVIGGAIEFLRTQGTAVGIYSSPSQWAQIAGTYSPGLPVWVAMAPSASAAPAYCSRGFGGGEVQLVQYISGGYDTNYACRAADRLIGSAGPVGAPGSTAVVVSDTDCLNVRAQAGITSTIRGCLATGTRVTLLQGSVPADGFRWQLISSGSVTGWVADHYLQAIVPTATPIATPIATPTSTVPALSGRFSSTPTYSEQGLALSVFEGGTVAQLTVAATGAGATGVWAQDPAGQFVLLVIGGPAFLAVPFEAAFPNGFATPTAVTLVRLRS